MTEKEFNLLEEPWIRVMLPDHEVREVSLTEALTGAHTFSALAGELPTQDMAVLRLLLAVLHTVFYRVGVQGETAPLQGADDALDRWELLWHEKRFPEAPLRAYLTAWRERFYLFHPERPFYQVPEAARGTEFTAAKLDGEISESSNKVRLFPVKTGADRSRLSYGEAARWLLHLNGFDDMAGKAKGKGLPSPGVGWLGKLGMIAAQGDNLFETLMLNLVLLNRKVLWGEPRPVWELAQSRSRERCKIPLPDNQAELLTLQSRRLLLLREGEAVTGYRLLGGDFFDEKNAYVEQMTQWMHIRGKRNQPGYDQPRRHDPARQIWREFSTIVPTDDNGARENDPPMPGVVRWLGVLQSEEILPEERIARFAVAGTQFGGTQNSYVTDTYSDGLSFHLGLLNSAGWSWRHILEDELAQVNRVADTVKLLGINLNKAAGGTGEAFGKELKEQFYARMDLVFRAFLASVDPADDTQTKLDRLSGWHKQEKHIALALGREAVERCGPEAFVGRTIKEKIKGREETRHYSAPEAYNWFMTGMRREFKEGVEA